jgi:hypothetical protein
LIFQKFSIIKETKFEEQEDDSRNDENYVGNSKVEIKKELISLSKDEKKETIKKENQMLNYGVSKKFVNGLEELELYMKKRSMIICFNKMKLMELH